jgi:HSP20 family protein
MEEYMAANQTQTGTASRNTEEAQASQQGQRSRDNRSDESQARRDTRNDQSEARRDNLLARREPALFASPFALLQRFFTDDMTGMLDRLSGQRAMSTRPRQGDGGAALWMPNIDVVQRGNEFVVRADLPGVNADDITVEISDDAITISGEREQEHAEEHGSIYRYERTYGSFFREIPLPEGAIADRATASFKDGVLEITVPAPPDQVSRGRRVEISRGDETKAANKKEGV